MKVKVGVLDYWAHHYDEADTVIVGMWYYKVLYVPNIVSHYHISA